MSTSKPRQLSTAAARRETVLRTAVHTFAARGYYGTTTVEVAAAAGISQAYLYRLFADKETLFAAVVDYASEQILRCHTEGAAAAGGSDPDQVLEAMAGAYSQLIDDQDLLRVLLHAVSAAREPVIGEAVRTCYAKQVEYVRAASGGSPEQIRRFFGAGLLHNAVSAMDIDSLDAPWARTLRAD